jgi:hypothetical protein
MLLNRDVPARVFKEVASIKHVSDKLLLTAALSQ